MLRTSGWKSIFICWVAIAGKYLIFFLLKFLLSLLLYLVVFRPASRPSLEAGSIFFFFWNISFSCSFLFSYLCRTRTATARGRFRRAPSTRISALEPGSGAVDSSSSSSSSASGSSSSWTSHLVWVSWDRRSPRKQTLVAINVFEGSN